MVNTDLITDSSEDRVKLLVTGVTQGPAVVVVAHHCPVQVVSTWEQLQCPWWGHCRSQCWRFLGLTSWGSSEPWSQHTGVSSQVSLWGRSKNICCYIVFEKSLKIHVNSCTLIKQHWIFCWPLFQPHFSTIFHLVTTSQHPLQDLHTPDRMLVVCFLC